MSLNKLAGLINIQVFSGKVMLPLAEESNLFVIFQNIWKEISVFSGHPCAKNIAFECTIHWLYFINSYTKTKDPGPIMHEGFMSIFGCVCLRDE